MARGTTMDSGASGRQRMPRQLHRLPGEAIEPASDIPILGAAGVEVCDAKDLRVLRQVLDEAQGLMVELEDVRPHLSHIAKQPGPEVAILRPAAVESLEDILLDLGWQLVNEGGRPGVHGPHCAEIKHTPVHRIGDGHEILASRRQRGGACIGALVELSGQVPPPAQVTEVGPRVLAAVARAAAEALAVHPLEDPPLLLLLLQGLQLLEGCPIDAHMLGPYSPGEGEQTAPDVAVFSAGGVERRRDGRLHSHGQRVQEMVLVVSES
mmetsp:Transcript_82421/g.238052  ORF Transcript_82421/g.238052 Transcript_82421/m.238052 type:complete len:266 (+) Transcript_82421:480-1277(+)